MGEEFNTKQQYKSDHPHSLSTSKHIYGVTFILSKWKKMSRKCLVLRKGSEWPRKVGGVILMDNTEKY